MYIPASGLTKLLVIEGMFVLPSDFYAEVLNPSVIGSSLDRGCAKKVQCSWLN